MRDHNNIYVDVNNSKYKGNIYNFTKLTKRDLILYLKKLSRYRYTKTKIKNENNRTCSKALYSTKFDKLSTSYLQRIYTRQQLENGIASCLFMIHQLN